MDLQKMIAELTTERDRLDEAILALERLAAGKARRRGRPPSWLKDEIERHSQEETAEPESAPATGRRARAQSERAAEQKETA
jgi:hypothetical protein